MQNNNLETALSQIKPSLTQMEREMLQSRVRERVVASMMGSVNTKTFTLQNYMVPLIALAVLLFGTGSAALASDAARPGDILFPVDTAMENLSLALSNDSRKAELRVLLADERFKEFSQLVEEALKNSPSATTTQATSSATTTATSTTATSSVATSSITEIEADVFTDVTIIKVEISDKKVVFTTDKKTLADIAQVVATRFGVTADFVRSIINLEIEDRMSRPQDSFTKTIPEKYKGKLDTSLALLGLYLGTAVNNASTSEALKERIADLEKRLIDRTADLDDDFRVKTWDDKDRYEIRTEDGRVRVEVKDGEVRIKSKGNDDSDDDDDRRSSSTSSSTSSSLELEADVFTDITVIEIERNDVKSVYTTTDKTRSEVIDFILSKVSGYSRADIDARLDFEIEDRASRTDDIRNSDDDNDDSDSRDDNDDDNDRSGGDSDDNDDSDDSDDRDRDSDDDEDEDDDRDDDNDDDDDHSGKGRGGDDKDDDD